MRDERQKSGKRLQEKKGGGRLWSSLHNVFGFKRERYRCLSRGICRTVMRSDFTFNRIPEAALRSTGTSYARVQGRPVRRANVITQEREDGAWARGGKMGVVRKDQALNVFGG